ncbi:MAG: BatD family protein [Dysgonamonadaceae bacterium]|nr:BatD family protein [Dysgonamonadaceae bacterium]
MKQLFFLLFLFTGTSVVLAEDVTFKATVTSSSVVVGQQFRLTYTVTNEEGKDFRLPEITDFELLFGPTKGRSASTILSNNQLVNEVSYSYTYVLLANKEGTFTIPPATIKIGNSEYKSNSLTIKVLPNNDANDKAVKEAASGSTSISDEGIFIRMHVSKNSVYANEGLLVTFKLYSLYDVRGLENYKFPEFEGFVAQEIELPQNSQWDLESYNGRTYRTVVLKQTVLYPIRAGKITIPSGHLDAVIQVRSKQQIRSIFDDFFDSYVPVKKTLKTAAATIDVKALPSEKPAAFNGAVGDYTMTSKINSTNVKTNESITIKLTISGNGNIKMIKNPEITFPNDFDVFDPKVTDNIKVSASGVSGTKTIEYYAIPRYAGDFTVPKAEFSYFDVKSGAYKTLATEEYQLHIEPGAEGTSAAPAVFNATNKEALKFVGQDIHYIKTKHISYNSNKQFFFGTLPYWLCYIIPALLFIIFFIIYRKQAAENANIALVRTKKANKVASKRLKLAGKLLKENKKEAFYDEVLKAVWGYLSDKLNIPVSSLTKDTVEAELDKYGAGKDLITQFMDILNTCEFARYAPAQDSHEMDQLYELTLQAIDKMENTIKK